jgi:hypothetical protein
MKENLQYKLFNKYPFIFRQKDLPQSQSLMCYGLDVGSGWFELLDELCYLTQRYIDRSDGKVPQLEAEQVKEKFGGLRFYYVGGDDYIRALVDMAEFKSFKICEMCGNKGIRRRGGWVRVLCGKCHKKRMKV